MDPQYVRDYEQLYREHWWWRSREQFVFQVLRAARISKAGQVLDVGCGGGWAFDRWAEFGSVQGVEIDSGLVESADRHRSQIYCGPFDRRFQPGRRFTLILMLDVLEHLADASAALDYAVELLEEDGRILITVPAMPALWTSHDDLNHHYIRYSRAILGELVTSAGLQIERLQYFFHWLVPLKLGMRLKEQLIATHPQPPTVPPRLLNALLTKLTLGEQAFCTRWQLPFGSSLFCLARKTAGSQR